MKTTTTVAERQGDQTANSGITGVTFGSTINGVDLEPVTITPEQFHDLATGELPLMPPKPAPKMILRVPSDSEFGEDDEFFISTPLRHRAVVLRQRHPDLFEHLGNLSVTYLWKKSGGKSKGVAVYGKCEKWTGLKKHLAQTTFVIWLAADHCRGAYYGDPEIEQLLFHEMLHTSVGEPDEETGRGGGPVLVPHQLEIFDAEIEVYGLAGIALREAAPLFRAAFYGAPVKDDDALHVSVDYVDPATLPAEGILIHSNGTPLTAEEIEEQTAAELRDDPAEFDDDEEDAKADRAMSRSSGLAGDD